MQERARNLRLWLLPSKLTPTKRKRALVWLTRRRNNSVTFATSTRWIFPPQYFLYCTGTSSELGLLRDRARRRHFSWTELLKDQLCTYVRERFLQVLEHFGESLYIYVCVRTIMYVYKQASKLASKRVSPVTNLQLFLRASWRSTGTTRW